MQKKKCDEYDLKFFKNLRDDWFLLCTKTPDGETDIMTAQWGFCGHLWNGECVALLIDPSRYSKVLLDKSEKVSINFFPNSMKKKLIYAGTHSGADEDKIAKLDFHLLVDDEEYPYLEESELTYLCHLAYHSKMEESSFLDKAILDKEYISKNKALPELYLFKIDYILQE